MTRFLGLLAAGLLLLAACSKQDAVPQAQEPDANAVAYFCHMTLAEHEGPKAQAYMRGRDKPYWFASASEAFVFLQTEVFQPNDLLALYVNDMSRGTWEHPAPGAWVEIHKAVFVLDSSKTASMGGKEAVPFASEAAAEAFVKQYGGTIVDFAAAAKALAVDQPTSGS
ncbi:MAG TPA: nitrous oxide reductase accessory protein NosL [Candidatus Binatia bacterium]|nr:nitrous oxide reductase accessory protein NosL [Candidatus Binatia bacterium]